MSMTPADNFYSYMAELILEDLVDGNGDFDQKDFDRIMDQAKDEKINELFSRIAELEKIEEKLRYNHMINEDAFFTNQEQAKKIKELQDQLTTANKRIEVLEEALYCIDSIVQREINEYGNSSELVELRGVFDEALAKSEELKNGPA